MSEFTGFISASNELTDLTIEIRTQVTNNKNRVTINKWHHIIFFMNNIISRETLSKRLKEIREGQGKSIREFANLLGVNYGTYYRTESGAHRTSNVKLNVLQPIMDKLNINPDWLLYEDCTHKYKRSENAQKAENELSDIINDLEDDKMITLLALAKALR